MPLCYVGRCTVASPYVIASVIRYTRIAPSLSEQRRYTLLRKTRHTGRIAYSPNDSRPIVSTLGHDSDVKNDARGRYFVRSSRVDILSETLCYALVKCCQVYQTDISATVTLLSRFPLFTCDIHLSSPIEYCRKPLTKRI